MSVVGYIVLFIVFEIIVYVVRAILSTDVMSHAMTALFGNLSEPTANCVLMLAVDLAELIGVLIVSSLTGYVCKYHLNLE
jgi:hypothetical protein